LSQFFLNWVLIFFFRYCLSVNNCIKIEISWVNIFFLNNFFIFIHNLLRRFFFFNFTDYGWLLHILINGFLWFRLDFLLIIYFFIFRVYYHLITFHYFFLRFSLNFWLINISLALIQLLYISLYIFWFIVQKLLIFLGISWCNFYIWISFNIWCILSWILNLISCYRSLLFLLFCNNDVRFLSCKYCTLIFNIIDIFHKCSILIYILNLLRLTWCQYTVVNLVYFIDLIQLLANFFFFNYFLLLLTTIYLLLLLGYLFDFWF